MEPFTLARALYDDGRYLESITEAERVLTDPLDCAERLRGMLLIASCAWELKRRDQSLAVLLQAGPLLDDAPLHLKGKFYGQRALLYRNAGKLDKALIDYEAARFWAQQAGDRECEARVRNNLAKVYSDLRRFDEALEESRQAINIVTELNETNLAGRFWDLRAQICFDHKDYERSLASSVAAVNLLRGHPAELEAQQTHDRAFRKVSADYLREKDPVKKFCIRRMIAKGLGEPIDAETIRLALSRTDGHVARAADILNVKHPSLIEAIQKHNLKRQPPRKRRTKHEIRVT